MNLSWLDVLVVGFLSTAYMHVIGWAFKWTPRQTLVLIPGLSFFMSAVVIISERVK